MPYRCFQLIFPASIGYTLVLLSVWNTLLVLGPLVFTRLRSVVGIRNSTVYDLDQSKVFTGSGMGAISEGVPVRWHLTLDSQALNAEYRSRENGMITVSDLQRILQEYGSNQTKSVGLVKNSTSNSDEGERSVHDCRLNLMMTDQCVSLIQGQPFVSKVTTRSPIKPECSLQHLLGNCSAFRYAHGYEDKPVTAEELDYPLAFALKMHTSPLQAEQLLRTIYRPHNVYCIHVDRKAEEGVFETMKSVSSCLKNVFLIEDRESVVYMSSAAVKAEIKCMKRLIQSKVNWRYYINLAGQEFPLRTNLEIVMMLKRFHGANDIESYDHPTYQQWRYKKRFIVRDDKLEQTTLDKKPFGYPMQLSKGSAYGMFTRDFVNFILTDDVSQKFLAWLNDTSSPDENAWATLNTLPWAPGGTIVVTRQTFNTHASRALIWTWEKTECHGKFVRSVCVFGGRDLKWLTSRPNVIANKFNNDLDPLPLQCLESWLAKRISRPSIQTVNKQYIDNLPHVEYYRNLDKKMLSDKYFHYKKRKWLERHPWRDA